MRPKFVAGLLTVAVLFLAIVFIIKQHVAPDRGNLPAAPVSTPVTPVAVAPAPPKIVTTPPDPAVPQAAVDAEVGRLNQLAMNDDAASLKEIEDDLLSPAKAIRTAAIIAAKVYASTNAIPSLQQASESVEDPREKVAMLDAIDYLNLPRASDMPPPNADQIQAAQQRRAAQQAKELARQQARQLAPPTADAGNSAAPADGGQPAPSAGTGQ